jgi:hypothetical protein
MSIATALAYWSGVAFVAPDLPASAVFGTVFVVHGCDAALCRILAGNGGRPRTPWMFIGFVGGIAAVALLLLLPRRARGVPAA